MVLSRSATAADQAGLSSYVFDGTQDTNLTKIFFYFENVAMRCISNEDKAGGLLAYLDGKVFSFYYDTFSRDGALLETAKDYNTVKAAIVNHFKQEVQSEELTRQAVAARLNYDDIEGSLKDMDRFFGKANFNEEAKFGLLRSPITDHFELAQFAILRGAKDNQELKKLIKDFVNGRKIFLSFKALSEQPFDQVLRAAARATQVSWHDQTPKKILALDHQRNELGQKVDALAEQLSQSTILVKKNQGSGLPRCQVGGRICSYCRRSGHYANQCDANPHSNNVCPRCGKRGHSESTCWAKNPSEMTRKVANAHSESEIEKKIAVTSQREEDEKAESHVSVVTEATNVEGGDLVAAAKRTADGQAIVKQQTVGLQETTEPPMKHLRYPSFVPGPPIPQKQTNLKSSAYKRRPSSGKVAKVKKGLQEQASKYQAISELANAPSGLTFVQLIRGDADDARRELRRLLGGGFRNTRALATPVGSHTCRLKVVTVRVYGTNAQALLDPGAVPDLISAKLTSSLGLQPHATARKITVADGSSSMCTGTLSNVPVSFLES